MVTGANRSRSGEARCRSIRLVLYGFFAGAAAFPPTARSQDPPPTFPAQVEQVTVDVVVSDKKGNPVTGLTTEDFQVYENGVPQTIASFDAVEIAAAPAEKPAPRPKVSTNARKGERRGRTFVIVFDDIHLTPFTAQRAKAAMADFLRTETREGDRVTLVAAGGGAGWSTRMEAGRDEMIDLVKRLQGRYFPDTGRDRMSDYEAMRIHVFRDEMMMNRVQRRFETAGLTTVMQQSRHVSGPRAVEDPFVTGRAAEVYFGATARNRITLEALERSLQALVGVQGRKSLILVSEGFIYDPHLDVFKRLVDASRRANTAIYFVNSRGLEGLPLSMTAEFAAPLPPEDIGSAFSESFETTEGSESLAADSGGFTVRNTNDLTSGFKRIADETRVHYLIGYNPTNAARDGTFRKIQVKVRAGKGVQIRSRKGYYAPSDRETALSPKPGDPVFQRALDSPYEEDDVPLRMTHFVREETPLLGRARVLVAVEVDIRSLGFQEEDGRSMGALQFLLVAANRETGEFFRYDEKVDLKLPPADRERLVRTWLPIVREFGLVAGRYQAKIVVRDKATGRIGTVVHEFAVPDLGQFRVTTPVLSDVRDTEDGGTGDGLAILARRDFPQGTSLFCQFHVYGATRLETSRMPRVSMGYQVRRTDGTLYTQDTPSIINPTPDGSLSRQIGFSLEDATPGEYEIVMRVKDELSGKSLELHEPFSVSAPLPPAPPVPSGG